MAKVTSGSFNTTAYSGRYLTLSWTATQNIEKNESTISWTLKGAGGDSGYIKAGMFSVAINGYVVYELTNARINLYKGTVVASGTKTIAHNTDGTKSFSMSAEGAIHSLAVNCRGSGSWELKDIPRAATITSADNFNDENNPIIFYSNPAGEAVERLEACIADNTGYNIIVPYRAISKTSGVYAFYFTEEEREALRAAVTSGHTLPVRFYLKTTIGGTNYLKYSAKTLTLVDYEPTISYFEVADENEITRDLTRTDGSVLIKGYNNVFCYFDGAGAKGATITSYKLTNGSSVINDSSGYFENTKSGVFVATVTDSRGNTASTTVELPVINYFKPTVRQKVEMKLVGETEASIKVTASGEFFRGYFETDSTQGEPNNLQMFYFIREAGSTYASFEQFPPDAVYSYGTNSYEASFTITGLEYNKSYEICCGARDELEEISSTIYRINLTPVYYWGKDSFNLNVPLYIEDNKLTDYIVEQGEQAMGSNGTWRWEKWASGKAVCYGKRNYGNMAVSSAWGSIYQSAQFSQALPYNLFIAAPEYLDIQVVSASAMAMVAQGTSGGATKDSTGNFLVWRPTSMTVSQVYLGFYAIGRWK